MMSLASFVFQLGLTQSFAHLGLMQNATAEEKTALAGAIRDIEDGDLDDEIRALLVALELFNLAGIGVLTGAIDLLKSDGPPRES